MSIFSEQVTAHGMRYAYLRYAPHDPRPTPTDRDPVVLLHGVAGSSATWLPVLSELARRQFPRAVIAPDALGHGGSAKPRNGDYSLAAQATTVRDLLLLLGHKRATLAGHSLGGGTALQFAYQYPEMCGRLVLVSSGGLGRTVSPVIRASKLPGAGAFLRVAVNRAVGSSLERHSRGWQAERRELARHLASLADAGARRAYLHEVGAAIDLRGQRLTATDRLYLTEAVPSLIVWGEKDRIIPVEHGHRAANAMPGSRLVVFGGCGHFPHCGEPRRFADVLTDFVYSTAPASLDADAVRKLVHLATTRDA